ncbi:hypothetical protein HHL17_18870 [Chitinophaga sp. G-6-1-13]|uniref:Outer membrane protein beta-barrel domain-containing protein n=1 Tax=Chitinophaga fulva TaxID=2728842 RepID=A0A848GRK3_9BACT|nr:hypothetical protein [Chitinophaga fulva]NML39270.1 hypothetical protein [Chitinophaga fulva]
MKKTTITVLAVAAFLSCNQLFAQQKKNFISAGFNVYNQKYESERGNGSVSNSSNTYFDFSPAYGYYFRERWAIGIQGFYGNQGSKPADEPERKGRNWGVGPFVRYEQPIWGKYLSVYTDGLLMAAFVKTDGFMSGGNYYNERNISTYSLSVVPGLLFHVTPSFSLTANLGSAFSANTKKDKVEGTGTKSTDTNVGLFKNFGLNNVSFGINFHF